MKTISWPLVYGADHLVEIYEYTQSHRADEPVWYLVSASQPKGPALACRTQLLGLNEHKLKAMALFQELNDQY